MRTWIEIDMDNLLFNIEKIRNQIKDKEMVAVIKADGYGFGSLELFQVLSKNGIKNFAVATLDEALDLRKKSQKENILILGALFNEEIRIASENHIQITVANWKQLEFIKEQKINVEFHVKIDTGMGRLGFLVEDGIKAIEYSLENNLNVVGIYSHLSDADALTEEGDSYTRVQIDRFSVFKKYEGIIKYIHILNSAGIIRFLDNSTYVGNTVRSGICMYGMIDNFKVDGFKEVFTLKTKILAVRIAEEDTYISYGRTFKLKKGEMFATLGIGYADGMDKAFSNSGYVLIHGEKCPVIGKVCMDMCMVQIPESIKDKIMIGDEVTVLTASIIENLSKTSICAWDIFTGIGRRVYRVYKMNDKPYLTLKI